ncbi:hypothetical protein SAMN05421734_104112 [Pelagirhabdus alkalitolerans]|uniref:Uncharacterized protein n=1 Tax=Pelagirhabdus alkalitolerans TaxID=1612202 RepID=A0A1G6IQZ2_9BACI|nr:hypothetical protein SAMN05421734_104112 [Pelagirhabdus alkalitolerans]
MIGFILSALIIFVAVILSFIAESVISIISFWILSGLLIYFLFNNEKAVDKTKGNKD